MIDYEVVAGSWPLPTIRLDLRGSHDGMYDPTKNEIQIGGMGRTPGLLSLALSHEFAHWGQFVSIDPVEWEIWVNNKPMYDPTVFARGLIALELAAYWSTDGYTPEYLQRNAERRRSQPKEALT